jgi:hypothetical protein
MDAPAYDPARERRKKIKIGATVVIILMLASLAYLYRNWREERVVDHFFTALQQQDYEKAYAIWMADPAWKQHPGKYARYPFNEFSRDWGPGGEWGIVKSHELRGSANPEGGSGIVVVVVVNGRAETARLWVEKKDKTLSFSPY